MAGRDIQTSSSGERNEMNFILLQAMLWPEALFLYFKEKGHLLAGTCLDNGHTI